MTDRSSIQQLRIPTDDKPLRILVSACLVGVMCGVNGDNYGDYPGVLRLLHVSTVKLTSFCPEDFAFGTPREMCDIHGGDGFDVLNGSAHVLTSSGTDWTKGMIAASEKMLDVARRADIELAIMMDISAACGSQVISDGNRYATDRKYQIGMGVCAAQLARAGFKVISQRDYAALEILYTKIDPAHEADGAAKDAHEIDWYLDYFRR